MNSTLSFSFKAIALFVLMFFTPYIGTAQELEEIPNPPTKFHFYTVKTSDSQVLVGFLDDDENLSFNRFDGVSLSPSFDFSPEPEIFYSSTLGEKDYFFSFLNETNLYTYDHTTDTKTSFEIPNNHFAPEFALNYNNNPYYYAYDQVNFERFFYRIEQDNFTEISLPVDINLGAAFDMVGGKMLCNFIDTAFTEDFLYTYDGTDFELITPNVNSIFYPTSIDIESDDALLLFRDTVAEVNSMYNFDGTTLAEIPSPPSTSINTIMGRSENLIFLDCQNTTTGDFEFYTYDGSTFQLYPGVTPGHLFFRLLRNYDDKTSFMFFDQNTGITYLYVFDQTSNTLALITPPQGSNLNFFTEIGAVGNKLYLNFTDQDLNSSLLEVEFGSTEATISDIDLLGLNLGFLRAERNGKLYWDLFDNATFESTLFEFDGTTLTEIPNPPNSSLDAFAFSLEDGNDLYFIYNDLDFAATIYRLSEGTVSLVENSISKNITVFPNPASDFIQVDLEEENITNVELRLTSVLGESIFYEQSFFNDGSTIKINTSNLSSGIYILSGKTNQGDFNKKIIIEK